MITDVKIYGLEESIRASKYPMAVDTLSCTSKITNVTKKLGSVPTGTGHDNFLKGIIVQFDLTMTPKMSVHRITKFDLDKIYIKYVDPRVIDIMKQKVEEYNQLEDEKQKKEKYLELLYTNPCGMYLTARMTTNYQQLKTIYQQRRTHRLPEWQEFCDWVETLPHFKELCLNVEN